jgi:hypothetical protein
MIRGSHFTLLWRDGTGVVELVGVHGGGSDSKLVSDVIAMKAIIGHQLGTSIFAEIKPSP